MLIRSHHLEWCRSSTSRVHQFSSFVPPSHRGAPYQPSGLDVQDAVWVPCMSPRGDVCRGARFEPCALYQRQDAPARHTTAEAEPHLHCLLRVLWRLACVVVRARAQDMLRAERERVHPVPVAFQRAHQLAFSCNKQQATQQQTMRGARQVAFDKLVP